MATQTGWLKPNRFPAKWARAKIESPLLIKCQTQWRLITRDSLKDQMDGPSVPSFSIISRYPYIPLDLCATHGFNLLLPPAHS